MKHLLSWSSVLLCSWFRPFMPSSGWDWSFVLSGRGCVAWRWCVMIKSRIQRKEKEAAAKVLQEVGTFWHVCFNTWHTVTPATTSGNASAGVWLDLRAPCDLCQFSPRVGCRGSGDPDTMAVGKWSVISQREINILHYHQGRSTGCSRGRKCIRTEQKRL